ncbi:GGDEF domain-containing protein [Williamsia deligens]|uniref:Diguanylate cyclase n=1 Tax=Williamsia deligens TaxID=321325 RepID=A0ABW3G7Y3_9NOCA|nr:GGDEF domain-containing protein [Williamsia deligens]MCP2192651.1 diguanylate cyclase (GGDEF) domain-containing protein [Williamsia deligens]
MGYGRDVVIRLPVALEQLGWVLLHWWRRADQFPWVSAYLADRQLIEPARLIMAVVTAMISLVPIVYVAGGDTTGIWTGLGTASAVVGVLGAAMWLVLPWPSATRSRLWVAVCDIGTAIGCLAQSEALGGIYGCAVFAVISGYIAIFHGARMLSAHLVFTVVFSVALAWRLVEAGSSGTVLATIAVVQTVLVAVMVPVVTQFLLETLSSEAAASEVDTLTGVLNRRGLDRALERMTAMNDRGVAVIVADLDNFKEINDRYGHRHGDSVLAQIAVRLREAVGTSGVVARIGGDEFVIADSLRWTDPTRLATHVLHTISAVTDPVVTASVGVVHMTGDMAGTHRLMATSLYTELADAAMYEAKRAGGNTVRTRVHHHQGGQAW